MTLQEFNELPVHRAHEEMQKCCGSSRWVQLMVEARPYQSIPAVKVRAEEKWRALKEDDWLEVFEHHAKIGDIESLKKKFAESKEWSNAEQSGMATATPQQIEGLASGNVAYEAKFGFIFLIFATGKSAGEMLEALSTRLENDRKAEIENVVEEQNKITQLRIEKLLN